MKKLIINTALVIALIGGFSTTHAMQPARGYNATGYKWWGESTFNVLSNFGSKLWNSSSDTSISLNPKVWLGAFTAFVFGGYFGNFWNKNAKIKKRAQQSTSQPELKRNLSDMTPKDRQANPSHINQSFPVLIPSVLPLQRESQQEQKINNDIIAAVAHEYDLMVPHRIFQEGFSQLDTMSKEDLMAEISKYSADCEWYKALCHKLYYSYIRNGKPENQDTQIKMSQVERQQEQKINNDIIAAVAREYDLMVPHRIFQEGFSQLDTMSKENLMAEISKYSADCEWYKALCHKLYYSHLRKVSYTVISQPKKESRIIVINPEPEPKVTHVVQNESQTERERKISVDPIEPKPGFAIKTNEPCPILITVPPNNTEELADALPRSESEVKTQEEQQKKGLDLRMSVVRHYDIWPVNKSELSGSIPITIVNPQQDTDFETKRNLDTNTIRTQRKEQDSKVSVWNAKLEQKQTGVKISIGDDRSSYFLISPSNFKQALASISDRLGRETWRGTAFVDATFSGNAELIGLPSNPLEPIALHLTVEKPKFDIVQLTLKYPAIKYPVPQGSAFTYPEYLEKQVFNATVPLGECVTDYSQYSVPRCRNCNLELEEGGGICCLCKFSRNPVGKKAGKFANA